MPTYSEQLASWFLSLRLEDLPDDVVEATKHQILDTLGVMPVAADTPIGRTVRQTVTVMRSGSDSRMIGYGDRATAIGAALVNGTLAHAMDFDDSHAARIRPSTSSFIGASVICGSQTRRSLDHAGPVLMARRWRPLIAAGMSAVGA